MLLMFHVKHFKLSCILKVLVRMKVSPSESKTIVFNWIRVEGSLCIGLFRQVEKFKYLRILFKNNGRME